MEVYGEGEKQALICREPGAGVQKIFLNMRHKTLSMNDSVLTDMLSKEKSSSIRRILNNAVYIILNTND